MSVNGGSRREVGKRVSGRTKPRQPFRLPSHDVQTQEKRFFITDGDTCTIVMISTASGRYYCTTTSVTGRGIEERLSSKRDKNHILFGGTKILQHTPDKSFHLKSPDGGCVAVVLRTGFETSQGKLMRTILFSSERVTANSRESGLFILFLVFFAIIAAGYVLKKGLEDPTRSKYKLILSCSLIITSVIPPELPMELSIAVNTSLIALARRGIFCTEPFRIPFAGKVDICCFDKTGTLTSDDMEYCGVVAFTSNPDLESDANKLPRRTVEVLSACHSLVFVDNKLVGDPLEKAALKGIDWIYTSDEKAMPKRMRLSLLWVARLANHMCGLLARVDSGWMVRRGLVQQWLGQGQRSFVGGWTAGWQVNCSLDCRPVTENRAAAVPVEGRMVLGLARDLKRGFPPLQSPNFRL
ncbi:putative cation-transporting ATPase [Platanthera guangdongensis]|uniref:Cation-transporting ATPase n=1 Tax=Platanthera guangdongensis TaxID=2320717 RepID=A0ABR2LNX3_9ASPA